MYTCLCIHDYILRLPYCVLVGGRIPAGLMNAPPTLSFGTYTPNLDNDRTSIMFELIDNVHIHVCDYNPLINVNYWLYRDPIKNW